MNLHFQETKLLLDERARRYNNIDFITTDPIQVPHRFHKKEDIEIAGFLAATIAWGQRKSIIKNGFRLMEMMDNSPYDFIMQTSIGCGNKSCSELNSFVHRTFNGSDCLFFLSSLQNIYRNHSGLEQVFTEGYRTQGSVFGALKHFRKVFLEIPHDKHALHIQIQY